MDIGKRNAGISVYINFFALLFKSKWQIYISDDGSNRRPHQKWTSFCVYVCSVSVRRIGKLCVFGEFRNRKRYQNNCTKRVWCFFGDCEIVKTKLVYWIERKIDFASLFSFEFRINAHIICVRFSDQCNMAFGVRASSKYWNENR